MFNQNNQQEASLNHIPAAKLDANDLSQPEARDSASVLMVGPAVGSGSPPEYHLVDSDPNTVWHSKAGEDYVKIAVDLHSELCPPLWTRGTRLK